MISGAAVIVVAYVIVTITTVYALIFVFAFRIYSHLTHTVFTQLNQQRAKELNLQLSMALLLQAMVPFLLEFMPTSSMAGVLFMGYDVGVMTPYLLTLPVWTPIMDPLITIWIVKSYRRHTINLVISTLRLESYIRTQVVEVTPQAHDIAK